MNNARLYLYLMIVAGAGCLMLVSGCAKEQVPQLVIKEAKPPAVAGWMMKKPKMPVCEDAGKQDYTVPELENARACYREHVEVLDRRLGALQATIKEREAK